MVRYKTVYLDSDTPLFQAAKSVQTDYIIAKHTTNGWSKRFKNKTELWGHHSKKEGGWLADRNIKNPDDVWLPDDLEIEELAELSKDITDHLDYAFMQFNSFIGKIKRWDFAEDYVLVIGGEGNFRYDAAQIQPYKGLRKDKPLLFHEVKQKIIQQYKNKVVLANNEEADDVISAYAWQNYLNYRKAGVWRDVISFCDKDINMCPSPRFNYNDREPVIYIPTIDECALAFCSQMLSGDLTDNIAGLPNFTEEMQDKYEMGKTRGIGAATANRFLRTCKTPKEMYERVTEAYKSYYGVEKKEVVGFRGNKLMYNYLDYMNEWAVLLWMKRSPDDQFNIRERLTLMGIEYEDDSSEK